MRTGPLGHASMTGLQALCGTASAAGGWLLERRGAARRDLRKDTAAARGREAIGIPTPRMLGVH